MTKTIQKHFWIDEEEAIMLRKKSEAVGLSEGSLLRMLIRGFRPREKPDGRFYEYQKKLEELSRNMQTAAFKSEGPDREQLEQEIQKLHQFQDEVEKNFCGRKRKRKNGGDKDLGRQRKSHKVHQLY